MNQLQPKAREATIELLSRHGFCVMHGGTAQRLLGIWSTAIAAGADYQNDEGAVRIIAGARGALIYSATLKGVERGILADPGRVTLLAAAHLDVPEIERRARALGLELSDVREWTPPEAAETPRTAPSADSDQPPTSWPSVARTRWYQSRNLRDPLEDNGARPGLPTVDTGVFAGRQATKPRH